MPNTFYLSFHLPHVWLISRTCCPSSGSHTGPPGWTTTTTTSPQPCKHSLDCVPTSFFPFSSPLSTSQQEWSSENMMHHCSEDTPLGAAHCTKDAMQTSLSVHKAGQNLSPAYLLRPSQALPRSRFWPHSFSFSSSDSFHGSVGRHVLFPLHRLLPPTHG